MTFTEDEVRDLIGALNEARDTLRHARASIDARDAHIESLNALVALHEQRADDAERRAAQVEDELARLTAVYFRGLV